MSGLEWIECPWHGSHFNVKTGAVTSPPAPAGVRNFPVEVEGNDVLVEVDQHGLFMARHKPEVQAYDFGMTTFKSRKEGEGQ